MRFPGFIGQAYQMRAITADCQRLVNMYPDPDETGEAKEGEIGALLGTPGIAVLQALGSGPIRGMWTGQSNGRVFVVSGQYMYEVVNTAGVYSSVVLGQLQTSSGYVGMNDNGTQLCIVDGPNGYGYTFSETQVDAIPWSQLTYYNVGDIIVPNAGGQQFVVTVAGLSGAAEPVWPTTRFATVTDGTVTWEVTTTFYAFNSSTNNGFLGSNVVCYQDGYFIFAQPGKNVVYSSNLFSLTFNALNFLALEGSPDPVLNIFSLHKNLYIQTTKTTEIYYDAGISPGFPFSPISGAFIQQGLSAQFGVAQTANAIFWLGQDIAGGGIVYTTSTYLPQRISTFAIEQEIQSYSTISDAIAYVYQDSGHQFYVLSFPTAQKTWVYDISTGMWHERSYYIDGQEQNQRGIFHTFAFGIHLVGDYANGNVYQMSQSIMTDNGMLIIRRRTAPHLAKNMKRIFFSSFQLDIQQGVGLDGIQQGTDPQAMLRWSNDGARTWSNIQTVSYGKIGATLQRAIFRRLGQARDRVYEITISDPTFVALTGAELELEVGAS